MKHFKNLKKYPLMLVILISTLLFTLIGYLGKNNVYSDYSVDLLKTPQLAVVFEGIKDANYPWKMIGYGGNSDAEAFSDGRSDETITQVDTPDTKDSAGHNTKDTSDMTPSVTENSKDAKHDPDKDGQNTQDLDDGKNTGKRDSDKNNTTKDTNPSTDIGKGTASIDNSKTDNSTQDKNNSDSKPDKETGDEEDTYQFESVKKSYFNDALFIGDSRTVGLSEYSGWDKPTYYADVGLTIYDVFDKKVAEVNGKKFTIDKALKKKKFKKIYIMLGINELGRGTTKTFIEEYQKVISKIQKLQPDAIIFVEAIMNVSKKKSDSDPIFNNKNIKDKNDHLALFADNKDIFYIDVNEAITDKTGGIPEKYTFDNIHLKAAYYEIWTDFLKKHGIVKE